MAKLPAFLSHENNKAALSATTLAVTSANATYPGSNLKALPISKVWRSVVGVISAVDITLDFGSAKTISLIALINHNLTSTATIAIAAGTTTAYSNYSTSITWRQYDAFTYLTSSQSYRYWRIRITDASSTDNYIQAGYIMAGDVTVPVSTFQYGWQAIDEYINNEVQSEFGVPYIDELFYRMRFLFTFANKITAEITVLRTIFQGVKRNISPLFFIPDVNVNDGYIGRFVNHFERKFEVRTSITMMEFLEESRGKKISA